MKHATAILGWVGVFVLWGILAQGTMANEFYTNGTASTIDGAENLGKTWVHYGVTLGLPVLSAGLIGGGLLRLKERPREGMTGIGSGVAAGFAAKIVDGLHTNAAASDGLLRSGAGLPWVTVTTDVLLLAAAVALVMVLIKEGSRVAQVPQRVRRTRHAAVVGMG